MWISLIEHLIVPIGLEYQPELVLVSAGYDAHQDDPLGQCQLSTASFGQMTCHVRDFARDVGAPLGAVLEGGYAPAALGQSVVATIAALGAPARLSPPRPTQSSPPAPRHISVTAGHSDRAQAG